MRRGILFGAVASAGALVVGCALVAGLDERDLLASEPSDANATDGPTADSADAATDAAREASPPEAYAAAVIADGPIAYWRCNDPPDASVLKDEMGTYPATLSPNPPKIEAPGLFGPGSKSLVFDGSNGMLAEQAAIPYLGEIPFTFEAWIRFELNPPDALIRMVFLHSTGLESYAVSVDDALGFTFDRYVSDSQRTVVSMPVTPPVKFTWHHLVATHDGTKRKLWVDGEDAAPERTESGFLPGPRIFSMGAAKADKYSLPDGAKLTEIALYDKALLSTRVKAHFALGRAK